MNNSIKALAREAKLRMRASGAPDNRNSLPDIMQEEERIYRIVCRLQQQSDVVTNPIMQVADPILWQRLRGVDRERYVLHLSDVYLRQLQRYRLLNRQ